MSETGAGPIPRQGGPATYLRPDFDALFALSPLGVAESSADGTLVAVNPRFCAMLGYPASELVGRHASVLLADPSTAPRQLSDLTELHRRRRYVVERRFRHRDGTELTVLLGVNAVTGPGGVLTGALATVIDIGDQVTARARLADTHAELEARQALTDAVLASIEVGIVACDPEGRLTVFNAASRAWHGVDLDACPQEAADPSGFARSFDLYDPDGRPLQEIEIPLLRALREGEVRDVEMLIAPAGRPATRVLCSGQALLAADGRLLGAVATMTDVTAARAQSRALQQSEHRFRTTFVNDPSGLAVLATSGRATKVNPALCRLLGGSEEELTALAHPLVRTSAESGPGRAVDPLAPLLAEVRDTPASTAAAEVRLTRPDGERLWALITVTALPDAGAESALLLQVEDISDRKTAEQRLTRQALSDGLTNLPNRTLLLDRTSRALIRQQGRGPHRLVTLLFCDLDGFKAVNDTHGHAAGDHLLVEVARRLAGLIRPADTVARIGGDEFVVLCEDVVAPSEATRIASRLKAAIALPVRWNDREFSVTASIGVAHASPGSTAEDLVREADAAMYQAKRLGKDRHEVFDEHLRRTSKARVQSEQDLRTALATGGVEVHYQPIRTLPGGDVTAVEALVRLRLPDGRLAMPAAFIDVAETTGLIVPLGREVLRAACAQLAVWRRERPDLQIAVNLSAHQASRSDLGEVVRSALAAAGLPPDALALELTESALLEATGSTLHQLGELRRAGVAIGIDDFGTGYASLRYLRELPVTFLKVDRSFVAGMLDNHQDDVIVRAVTNLASDLGLGCVVEGIETVGQLEHITRDGIQAQGFLLGRPASADRITEQLGTAQPAPPRTIQDAGSRDSPLAAELR